MRAGKERFVSNRTNILLTAALTASAVQPSQAIFPLLTERAGRGQVRLTGAYTGTADRLYEIEIGSDGSSSRVSQPVFAGVGNGRLEALSVAPGNEPQTYTVRLDDLGTDTRAASLIVGTFELEALLAGAAGNGLALTVDESALTTGAAIGATTAEWAAGAESQSGVQWNFGAKPLGADGTISADAPRVMLGADPAIYRHFSNYVDGELRYFLSPPPARSIPADTPVYPVSGSRTVVLTQGATVESYPGIVTWYDFCAALRDRPSTVSRVRSVVANDRTPGGMAVTEFDLRTVAYHTGPRGSGSRYVTTRVPGQLLVQPTAPTETVRIECVDAAQVGRERWRVVGPVSGESPAITGEPYSGPALSFVIPRQVQSDQASGRVAVNEPAYASRSDGESAPPLHLDVVLGVAAVDETVTLTYRVPVAVGNCDPLQAPIAGRVRGECLGITLEGGMAENPVFLAAMQRLAAIRAVAAKANTRIDAAGNRVVSAAYDLDLIDQTILGAFYTVLEDIDSAGAWSVTAAIDAWTQYCDAMEVELGEIFSGFDDTPAAPSYVYSADYDIGDVVGRQGHTYQLTSTGYEPWSAGSSYGQPEVWTTDGSATRVTKSPSYDFDTGIGTVFVEYWTDQGANLLGSWDIRYTSSTGIFGADASAYTGSLTAFGRRYEAQMDHVRSLAGIRLKKSDAGREGTDCWRKPSDGEPYWEVVGSASGRFEPAITNEWYHSTVSEVAPGETKPLYRDAEKFAVLIRCKCPGNLKANDSITFNIGGAGSPATYQAGDAWVVPVVAASPRYFSGGMTGNNTHTWTVSGSVAGRLSNYVVVHGAEAAYSAAGLAFTIYRGAGVPFALGDAFTFTAESPRWRWRADAGAWSAWADLPTDPAALADGLSAVFTPGAAPSWRSGDTFGFRALQPHSPDHIRQPDETRFRLANTSVEVLIHPASAAPVQALVIALHDLPPDSTITLSGGSTPATADWSDVVAWQPGVIAHLLDRTATYYTLSITGAAGSSLGWVYLGEATQLTRPTSRCDIGDTFTMTIGAGLNPASRLGGFGRGAELAWELLAHDDLAALQAILRHAKQQGDEPIVLIPNWQHPDEAVLCRLPSELRPVDLFRLEPRERGRRIYSATLPLAPVLQ